jgi:hypothetical protein
MDGKLPMLYIPVAGSGGGSFSPLPKSDAMGHMSMQQASFCAPPWEGEDRQGGPQVRAVALTS